MRALRRSWRWRLAWPCCGSAVERSGRSPQLRRGERSRSPARRRSDERRRRRDQGRGDAGALRVIAVESVQVGGALTIDVPGLHDPAPGSSAFSPPHRGRYAITDYDNTEDDFEPRAREGSSCRVSIVVPGRPDAGALPGSGGHFRPRLDGRRSSCSATSPATASFAAREHSPDSIRSPLTVGTVRIRGARSRRARGPRRRGTGGQRRYQRPSSRSWAPRAASPRRAGGRQGRRRGHVQGGALGAAVDRTRRVPSPGSAISHGRRRWRVSAATPAASRSSSSATTRRRTWGARSLAVVGASAAARGGAATTGKGGRGGAFDVRADDIGRAAAVDLSAGTRRTGREASPATRRWETTAATRASARTRPARRPGERRQGERVAHSGHTTSTTTSADALPGIQQRGDRRCDSLAA